MLDSAVCVGGRQGVPDGKPGAEARKFPSGQQEVSQTQISASQVLCSLLVSIPATLSHIWTPSSKWKTLLLIILCMKHSLLLAAERARKVFFFPLADAEQTVFCVCVLTGMGHMWPRCGIFHLSIEVHKEFRILDFRFSF